MTADLNLRLMTGIDIPVPECQIVIRQPNLKEIGYMGEERFFTSISYLCVDKQALQYSYNEIESNTLTDINNFTLFQEVIKEKAEVKEMIKDLFSLLLPNYKIVFTPRAISLVRDGDTITIDEANFENFQQVIKHIFCLDNHDAQTYNPGGQKAREIANKIMRARQRVAALKKQEQQGMGSKIGQYISVITVGISSMSLQDVMQLTLFQMYDLINRFSLYTNWDVDLRARLAGAKAEKPLENWMKSLY